jgi:hypothetical protein
VPLDELQGTAELVDDRSLRLNAVQTDVAGLERYGRRRSVMRRQHRLKHGRPHRVLPACHSKRDSAARVLTLEVPAPCHCGHTSRNLEPSPLPRRMSADLHQQRCVILFPVRRGHEPHLTNTALDGLTNIVVVAALN